jgi:type IV pilus assembly protein PilC
MTAQWYKFKYYDDRGIRHSDQIKATTERAAKQYIHSKDFHLISIRPFYFFEYKLKRFKRSKLYLLLLQSKLSRSELYWFTKELVSFLESGLPLLNALISLRGFSASKQFQYILNSVIQDVQYGKSLSDSLSAFSSSFPSFYIISVRSGERIGKLEQSLRSNAEMLHWINSNRGKIMQATFFPFFSFIIIVASFVVSLQILVPYFMKVLKQMHQTPPFMTQLMFDLNQFLISNGIFFIYGFNALLILLVLVLSNKKSGYYFERFVLLKMPLYGSIYTLFVTTLLTRTLTLLVQQQFSILQTFHLCKDMFKSPLFYREIDTIHSKISCGYSIGQTFKESHLFPKFMGQMIRDGEQTGTLESKLVALSDLYKTKLENKVEWVFKMISPFYLVFTISITLFFGYAFFWPVWRLYF